MRALLSFAASLLTAIALNGHASAQPVPVESLGELSPVLSAFYECKPGPLVGGIRTWQEVTSLILVNQSTRFIDALVVFLDGNQRLLRIALVNLSPEDLDELNVCRTLEAGGVIPAPPAGLVEIVLLVPGTTVPTVGAYCWIKDFLGKFFVNVDEPFAGRVVGIGKTSCRVTPPNVTTAEEVLQKIQFVQRVAPILIEGTADPIP